MAIIVAINSNMIKVNAGDIQFWFRHKNLASTPVCMCSVICAALLLLLQFSELRPAVLHGRYSGRINLNLLQSSAARSTGSSSSSLSWNEFVVEKMTN